MPFVLIVDANETHASRASDALNAAGNACGQVTNAEHAIALLRWRVPDLILLDQAIPGADGGTLPNKLRGIAGMADLPIILLTTTATSASLGAHGNAVLDDIRKPFDPGFLVWRVNLALEARAACPLGESDEPLVVGPETEASLRSLA